ncbi:hypothetical protein CDL12_09991 [Handroanthus impetiginosus]|uniref:Uncharacterized protein n=1 Tax=Handroanthus impetiginosus TaxID=429701 RepID=A0A2G9HIS0_9LAMI|nr:hypothetical protein CDL12_09991 [Handroanthus impetiginosus]
MMALAEARAAWQRTANRCLVQEDAKRAPKLACCSSMPPSVKQAETGPTSAAAGQDNPSDSQPFDRNPSYSNLSPNSRWWLQLPPNYGYQKGLMDEQFTSVEGNNETYLIQDCSGDLARNEHESVLIHQISHVESPSDNQCKNFIAYDKKDFRVREENFRAFYDKKFQEPLKFEMKEDVYFDSESSWIGAEKNTPWWRTADTEELALLVAQRSLDPLENCDLPRPLNAHIKKDVNANMCCFDPDEISSSSLDQNPGAMDHYHFSTHDSVSVSLTPRSSWPKLRMSAEGQLESDSDMPERDSPRTPEMHTLEDDASKAQLLEALRHSQTRAREAEEVAKQARAEKEHVVKLLFRQASQLFAYKQWLQLLQLENMCFQYINNKSQSAPEMSPWAPLRTWKTQNGWPKSSGRKRAKRSRPWYNVGKCAVAFALGLGLVGAGLLLGWTIGWMLPAW